MAIIETVHDLLFLSQFIIIIPFVPSRGFGLSRHLPPLYSVVDFVQIHHFPIIPNTIHPSFSWSTPTPCFWFLTFHCPSTKLFHFHSLHVSVPSQSTCSNLLSQLCHLQFLFYIYVSHSFSSCYVLVSSLLARRHLISATSNFFSGSSFTTQVSAT